MCCVIAPNQSKYNEHDTVLWIIPVLKPGISKLIVINPVLKACLLTDVRDTAYINTFPKKLLKYIYIYIHGS